MQEVIQGNSALLDSLSRLCPADGVVHSADRYGNAQHWFELASPAYLTDAAKALAEAGARLALISGYAKGVTNDPTQVAHAACYHFVLEGIVYNVTANVTRLEPYVPTITPWFFNADWHEREMQELVGITVSDQPNPKRLFLDSRLDGGVLGNLVPLSVMMNGACSKDLWEHILAGKEGSN